MNLCGESERYDLSSRLNVLEQESRPAVRYQAWPETETRLPTLAYILVDIGVSMFTCRGPDARCSDRPSARTSVLQ